MCITSISYLKDSVAHAVVTLVFICSLQFSCYHYLQFFTELQANWLRNCRISYLKVMYSYNY